MSKGLSVVVGGAALVIVGVSLASVLPRTTNQGYAPTQPIPFSHKIHAGDNKIPCQYCHSDVEKSRHATIPSTAVCMNCHKVVKTTSPLIQKVRKAWEEGRAIQWIRIHELPDFVYFPHKRHLAAGLACQTCHGEIQTMSKVYQFAPLTMGWCLECHRGHSTPTDVLARAEAKGWPHGPGQVAPTQCSTCHY
jgi:hypothetical protein